MLMSMFLCHQNDGSEYFNRYYTAYKVVSINLIKGYASKNMRAKYYTKDLSSCD
jgi:hypothetical protein